MDPEDAFSSCFPSSSTSTRRRTCGYDVFLSFSGSDTRKKFTSHLFEAFKRNGIIAFRDDESLDRGAFIKPELLKAIEESEIAVVIFSGRYASSSWCLTELAKIVECMYKKTLTVLPVFYDVDPSDVRKLRGTFEDAFAKHRIDNTENVKTWEDAVSRVAEIAGWDLRDEPESTVIEKIIQRINNELDPTAFQEIGSIRDVEAELENIKNTVSTFQAVLQDAAEQQSRSHQDKDLLEKLKDAVYEVDDLLDEFYTEANAEALRQGGMSGNITEKVRGLFSTSNPRVLRREMSRKIIAMKQKLNAIAEDMADAILSAVAQKIIENLGSQTFQEIGSLWGLGDELEKVKNTVSTIEAVLLDAAEKQCHDHQVKDWLQKLNDAVYDADDLLSEFSTEATRRSMVRGNKLTTEVRTFFSSSNPLSFRGKMSRKIKAIRQKLNAIAEDGRNFHFKESLIESASAKREETHSFVPNIDVIGREDDKEAIKKLLLEPNMEENVSVIAIVGLGGIGKTTLAQLVYEDEKVIKHFELKIWVFVSEVFDVKEIVRKMIFRIGEKHEDHSMDQLQNQLREKIHLKKFLLVLDDVWNEDPHKWKNLKNLLMDGAKGSKVVITTRIKLVADITSSVVIYTLNCLSDDQSWSLFEQIAFEKGQETSNLKLEEIGREIVRKCQGIPLAIKTIGSILRFEEAEHKWSNVKNNLLESVTHQHGAILPILKLSYDNLPLHLKSCFAYCSLFPKDYEIEKETLIQLWIAQGFIQSSGKNQLLEDVADEYFKGLLWRSFFEEVRGEFGGLNYKMHDLMHDLVQSVAGGELELVDFAGRNIAENTRHVSYPLPIGSSFAETLSSLVKANKIRTFLLTYDKNGSGALEESTLNMLILNFKSLRALDLHGLQIKSVPQFVGKLKHLKYLDVSFNHGIRALPHSITRLLNLQTLKLSCCKNLKELPRNMGDLISLKHLDNGACDALSHMPSGLGQMTSLQTLALFVASKDPPFSKKIGGLGELNRLNNLRGALEIRNLERLEHGYSESKSANLREKQHLERLILSWDEEDNINKDDEKLLEGLQPHQSLKYLEVYRYGGVRFSSWLSSLTNLVDLYLQCQRCQHLPPLSHLPCLKRLSLLHMVNLEYISDSDISEEVTISLASSTTFFPSLNFVKIYKCPNLRGWWRMRDFVANSSRPDHQQRQHHQSLPSFPRLSSLHVQICPYLISMPLFPFLEEQLFLDNVSGKPLQQTMAATFSHLSPFSKLKSMHLINIRDIMYFPGLNMTYLKSLVIFKCPRLTSLSRAMQYLTSLEELAIHYCEEFNPSNDMDGKGLEWQHLNCLCSLTFEGLPKLVSLPTGLQYISTLQKLVISNCANLMTLPEWLSELISLEWLRIDGCPNLRSLPNGMNYLRSLRWLRIASLPHLMVFPKGINNLTSLEQLQIFNCPNLTSLPDGMRDLISLQQLKIEDCPLLEERCKKEIGEDWPNIAHIPNL